MQRTTNFWGELEDECIAALPSLNEKSTSHEAAFYAMDFNDYTIESQIFSLDHPLSQNDAEPTIELDDAKPAIAPQEDTALTKAAPSRKRKPLQIGNRELQFLGQNELLFKSRRNESSLKKAKTETPTADKKVVDDNDPIYEKKIRRVFKFFALACTRELELTKLSPEEKQFVNGFKKALRK